MVRGKSIKEGGGGGRYSPDWNIIRAWAILDSPVASPPSVDELWVAAVAVAPPWLLVFILLSFPTVGAVVVVGSMDTVLRRAVTS